MKLFFAFIFSVFCLSKLSAQSAYWAFAGKGSFLYSKKNYSASVEAYKKAFQIRKDQPTDLYQAACSAALAGQKEIAATFLKNAVQAGYLNYEHLQSDSDLVSLHPSKVWPDIVSKAKKNAVDVPKTYNTALRRELLDIYNNDQQIRRIYTDSIKKYGFTVKNAIIDSIIGVMGRNDSANLVKIVKILDKGGYPDIKKVGAEAAKTVFLVIQHADLAVQLRYFSALKEGVEKGNLRPANFALLEDRIALSEGRNQIYGSQIGADKKTGKYYVLPLKNPDGVDQRRISVGLGTLSDYLKQWEIVWDVADYKRKIAKGIIKNTMNENNH